MSPKFYFIVPIFAEMLAITHLMEKCRINICSQNKISRILMTVYLHIFLFRQKHKNKNGLFFSKFIEDSFST